MMILTEQANPTAPPRIDYGLDRWTTCRETAVKSRSQTAQPGLAAHARLMCQDAQAERSPCDHQHERSRSHAFEIADP